MIELQVPDWWEQVPVLAGPNVEVREVEIGDVNSLFELLTEPQVTKYISSPPPTISAFHGFIMWAHRQRQAGSCVCFAVVPKGLDHAIGLFQLRALEPSFKTAEWGFALGSSFWSTGIFLEAAALVVEFAFRTVGVHRLEARAVVDNSRGNRALEKLGATGEAVLRGAFNRRHSQFLWSLVSEEWKRPELRRQNPFNAVRLKQEIAQALSRNARTFRNTRPRTFASQLFPFFLTDGRTDRED
jgi:ribosomal-protein-alanine N-acetyltransferase